MCPLLLPVTHFDCAKPLDFGVRVQPFEDAIHVFADGFSNFLSLEILAPIASAVYVSQQGKDNKLSCFVCEVLQVTLVEQLISAAAKNLRSKAHQLFGICHVRGILPAGLEPTTSGS